MRASLFDLPEAEFLCRLRRFWVTRQGLAGIENDLPPVLLLERFGWIPELGGSALALAACARGLPLLRPTLDGRPSWVAVPGPGARRWWCPSRDLPLALATTAERAMEVAAWDAHVLGCSVEGLNAQALTLLAALGGLPRKESLLAGLVHAPALGLSCSGPALVAWLARLVAMARIQLIPCDIRLDRLDRVWVPLSLPDSLTQATDNFVESVCQRLFGWLGVVPFDTISLWSGLPTHRLWPLLVDQGYIAGPRKMWARFDVWRAVEQMGEPVSVASFLSPHDPLFAMMGGPGCFLDPQLPLPVWTPQGPRVLGPQGDVWHHLLLWDGRLVGCWDFSPLEGQVVLRLVGGLSSVVQADLRTRATNLGPWIENVIGDARIWRLDSPAARGGRLRFLRNVS